ncbi:HAD family hydrolase [Allokutzneria albata]|uniref:HAD family hydrolase n=1 Tax=Allokutzneria albata TaxID=211114 RepID=UPI0004C397EB|nr:HAD-IB family phosphatase [Allokutzneria albata]
MIRLVAFDLDGTLTRGRTCLETAADACGFADRMPVWQRSRTDQETATARLEAWELLRGSDIALLASVPLAPGAAEGIATLRTSGISTVIVSLAFTTHAEYFARKLGLDAVIATDPDRGRHVFSATKPVLLREHASSLGIGPEEIAAVGDSPGDVPMLSSCGTSVYVGGELPAGFRPTLHLPGGAIDEIARVVLGLGGR